MRVPHAINCENTRPSVARAMIARGCGGISRPYGTGVIRIGGYPALKRRANLTASLRDAWMRRSRGLHEIAGLGFAAVG